MAMPVTLKWKPPKLPDAKTAQYANTADYALYVHEGAILRSGTLLLSREFMYAPIAGLPGFDSDFDAAEVFAATYKKTHSFSRAFRKTALQGQKGIKAAFDYKWLWTAGSTTRRRNGETVESPRNIIDTGNLKASQQPVRFLP